eukprot:CAMPEP_0172430524 /NCGR_PEP_ID=MMETSP1064-20121228/54839_1 /TAXON_ID=202472 /ORGANISM="Aulacoseira subarctica , Strain CCAP 1002/5" /LENGTH=52 /DNA_ID=CAMNT_0013176643 /DNA_START=140 /DNA_END=294 /DNA_ORIENTATION=+
MRNEPVAPLHCPSILQMAPHLFVGVATGDATTEGLATGDFGELVATTGELVT